jgi:hypothetical protein
MNIALKRNIEIAQGIHRSKTWSSSVTKDTLTAYMEGLAVKNFDSRLDYYCVEASNRCWFIVNKNTIAELNGQPMIQNSNDVIPQYHHLRTVRLHDDGFMSCTCSYSFNI